MGLDKLGFGLDYFGFVLLLFVGLGWIPNKTDGAFGAESSRVSIVLFFLLLLLVLLHRRIDRRWGVWGESDDEGGLERMKGGLGEGVWGGGWLRLATRFLRIR